MLKVFNVGIIGYGFSAKIFHIPFVNALPESFKFHSIVQRSPSLDNDVRKDWPGVVRYDSTEELLKDPKLDVVIVTTAPESHYELTKLSLEAGKHVIVEKPFTVTSAEGKALIALASSKSLVLTVYHNRGWDSDFLTVAKLLSSPSPLGRISEFETHFDRHQPVAPSGIGWKNEDGPGHGVVYDLGTHLMYQAVVLFGAPNRITGFVGSNRTGSDLEDSATILLHYDKGKGTRETPLLCTVKATIVSPETNQLRYWVRGTEGSFKKFHLDSQEDHLIAGLRPGDAGYGLEPKERYGVLTKWNDGNPQTEIVPTVEPVTYTDFYRKLAKALAGDKTQVPVTPETATAVIRLVELARESAKQGRSLVVDL